MSGTVDWGTVQGIAIGVGVIMLLLAPFFWWLYDTDRFLFLSDKGIWLCAIFTLQIVDGTFQRHWFHVAVNVALLTVCGWRWYRYGQIWPDTGKS